MKNVKVRAIKVFKGAEKGDKLLLALDVDGTRRKRSVALEGAEKPSEAVERLVRRVSEAS